MWWRWWTWWRRRLSRVGQELESALLEQRCRLFVEIAEAAVGEQVTVAWIEKQLGVLDLSDELAGGGEVFVDPFVRLHHVDLDGDAIRPGSLELRGRHARGEQQRSPGAGARLREHLGRLGAQGEAR